MANLFSDTIFFSGDKTLAEITGLTFTADTTYTIYIGGSCFVREGTTGKGYPYNGENPFDWEYDGENTLYIGGNFSSPAYINVSD